MKLSDLHSAAVDYPKTGRPVPIRTLPYLDGKAKKPDWIATETAYIDPSKYYQSKRAIGRLFREISLPALDTLLTIQESERGQIGTKSSAELVTRDVYTVRLVEMDDLSLAVYKRVSDFIAIGANRDNETVSKLWELFWYYAQELQHICHCHTLSNRRNDMLAEEEVVVGTICARCPQPRKRTDLTSKMRENTFILVQEVGAQIEGMEGTPPEKSLERAWMAYRIAELKRATFGAQSFGWIALGEIFDAIKKIEKSRGG